jgi:hypothetical protein
MTTSCTGEHGTLEICRADPIRPPAANRQVLIFGLEVRLYSADRNLRTLPDHPDPSERR